MKRAQTLSGEIWRAMAALTIARARFHIIHPVCSTVGESGATGSGEVNENTLDDICENLDKECTDVKFLNDNRTELISQVLAEYAVCLILNSSIIDAIIR